MRGYSKIIKNEDGAVAVLVALLMVVIMGFSALVIDIGIITLTKSELQNAADSAALAAVHNLPNSSNAKSTALEYAEKNGVQSTNIEVTAPYKSDNTKIEVVCKRKVSYTVARVLGFKEKEIFARAVAKKDSKWAGEALPFINLDDKYSKDSEIIAWEKTGPGDFESIDNYKIVNKDDPDRLFFKVDYMNGVEVKKGTVADKKEKVGYVYEQHLPDKPVYILSLSNDVITRGRVKLIDGTYRNMYSNKNKLGNNDIIHPDQLVLLECIFHDYDGKGKTLYLTVKKDYDIVHGAFPTDYVSPDGGKYKLVE